MSLSNQASREVELDLFTLNVTPVTALSSEVLRDFLLIVRNVLGQEVQLLKGVPKRFLTFKVTTSLKGLMAYAGPIEGWAEEILLPSIKSGQIPECYQKGIGELHIEVSRLDNQSHFSGSITDD